MFLRLFTHSLQDRPIKAVLLTHWHNDHAAGARAIKDRLNANVYYHKREKPYFDGSAARSGFAGWFASLIPEFGLLVLLKGLIGNSVPKPVEPSVLVSDGENILEDFDVIETPGHTVGHTSYYYRPEQALFAGDALAVVHGRLRFMARPVTPDLTLARSSMVRCLSRDLKLICPRHREPLKEDTKREQDRLLAKLESSRDWPFSDESVRYYTVQRDRRRQFLNAPLVFAV